MDSHTALLWLIGATLLLAVAGALLNWWLHQRKRRARHLYYQRASREGQGHRSATAPSPLSGGMTPELALAIRAHADRTARRHWEAGPGAPKPSNPYDGGTPEHVLWFATYQLVMHELIEAASEPSTPAVQAPGDPGPSRP